MTSGIRSTSHPNSTSLRDCRMTPSLDCNAGSGYRCPVMKWNRAKGRKDRNVIDARGSSPPAGSGGGGLPIPGGVAGIGGGAGVVVLIIVVAISLLGGGGSSGSGFDVGSVFGSGLEAPGSQNPVGIPPDEDP